MNRRILLQTTGPAVLIGAVLFGTCLASVWSINRLQRNLACILSEDVASLEAAQELEIKLRQLRFHSFIYVIEPTAARHAPIAEDHRGFEIALEHAQDAANTAKESDLVQAIQIGYQRYRAQLKQNPPRPEVQGDLLHWADAHPIQHLVAPCQQLLAENKATMEQTARESEAVSQQAQLAMIFLGLLGPIGGLICGFGIARGVSRSIARLSVHLQDVNAQLDREVGTVRLAVSGDLHALDRQIEQVAGRVQEVAAQVQQQQQEMLRAEQLAAVGQLAASVAHEIRNPLMAIKLLIGAALCRRNDEVLTAEDLQVIYGEIARLEQTVQTLLDYARPPRVDRHDCDLRDVVTDAVDLVRARAVQQKVELHVRQPEEAVTVSLDPGQFGTVFTNLFLNALDAMPRGGRLEVDVAALSRKEVRLVVRDTGPGFAPAVVDRLFTPFTSTKPTGTGLGLSICRRVVREHGGSITAQNSPTGGARITLHLPVSLQEKVHADLAGRR
jgi:signal transduction histidine kinase